MAHTIRVVLVSTRYRGNLGSVCRAMANFDLADLWLVDPRADRDSHEARERAVHAAGLLDSAQVVATLTEALSGVDLAVGTTARSNPGTGRKRAAVMPGELAQLLPAEGRIGLVLGPEESGLTGEQLDRMDLLVTIPSAPGYSAMNLSHAAAILFYELTKAPMERRFRTCGLETRGQIEAALVRIASGLPLKDRPGVSLAIHTWLFKSTISEPEGRAILALMRQLEKRQAGDDRLPRIPTTHPQGALSQRPSSVTISNRSPKSSGAAVRRART